MHYVEVVADHSSGKHLTGKSFTAVFQGEKGVMLREHLKRATRSATKFLFLKYSSSLPSVRTVAVNIIYKIN